MRAVKNIGLAFMTLVLLSCTCKEKQGTQKKVVELISVTELEKVDESVQLIDIRTPKEYNEGYIKNAKNINFFEGNFIEEMSKLNKDEPIYIYCRSGGRSGRAAKKLQTAGFTKVYDLDGGILKWKSKGKSTSK